MNNGILSKILGWGFFGLQAVAQVTQNGVPHGFGQWAQLIGALVAAVGIHAASNVGQVVEQPTPTTEQVSPGVHVVQ